MKKHYYKFNYKDKNFDILRDYNFKYYPNWLFEKPTYAYKDEDYKRNTNHCLTILINQTDKVCGLLEWWEWGEAKTKILPFRKLRRYIKKHLPELLTKKIIMEMVETKYFTYEKE